MNGSRKVMCAALCLSLFFLISGCGYQKVIDRITNPQKKEVVQEENDPSNPENLPIDKFVEENPTAEGWVKSEGVWYFLRQGMPVKDEWVNYFNDRVYYLDANGYMAKNWLYLDGNWYYLDSFNGRVTGWNKLEGSYYYFNEQGIMQTGQINVDGSLYYLDKTGKMLEDQTLLLDGKQYSIDASGRMTEQPS